jgi:hypothetical protein
MMRILLCCIALGGCATQAAPTFSQLLNSAEAADDAIVIAATAALQAGSITSSQAVKVVAATDAINKALTLAYSAEQSNPTAAQAQLAAAMAQIVTVQGCVSAAHAAASIASIDQCLEGVP